MKLFWRFSCFLAIIENRETGRRFLIAPQPFVLIFDMEKAHSSEDRALNVQLSICERLALCMLISFNKCGYDCLLLNPCSSQVIYVHYQFKFCSFSRNIKQRNDMRWWRQTDHGRFTYPFHDQSSIALGVVIGRRWQGAIRRPTLIVRARWRIVIRQNADTSSGSIRKFRSSQKQHSRVITTILLSFHCINQTKNEIKIKESHKWTFNSQWLWRIAS